jgi:hypothetical protein
MFPCHSAVNMNSVRGSDRMSMQAKQSRSSSMRWLISPPSSIRAHSLAMVAEEHQMAPSASMVTPSGPPPSAHIRRVDSLVRQPRGRLAGLRRGPLRHRGRRPRRRRAARTLLSFEWCRSGALVNQIRVEPSALSNRGAWPGVAGGRPRRQWQSPPQRSRRRETTRLRSLPLRPLPGSHTTRSPA